MRWAWVFLALVAGALIGARLLQDPGYVLVRAGSWVFESSIAAAVIAALGIALAIFTLGAGLRYLMTSLGVYGRWRSGRQHTKRHDLWQRVIKDVSSGNWPGAAGKLAEAPTLPERQLEVFLILARGLWQREDDKELTALLTKARTDSPQLFNNLILAIARWQLSSGRARSALAYLSQISESDRSSSTWAGLYAWGCIELMQWESLRRHWPSVEKNGVLKDDAFRAQMPLLRAGKAMADSDIGDNVKGSWRTGLKNLPKKWRSDAKTLGLWADLLMNSGLDETAFELLDHGLTKDWQPILLRQFGRLSQPAVLALAIETAGTWRKNRADDAELLLALGRLLNTNNQQAQARKHLLRAVQALGLTTGGSQNPQELEGLILTELGRSGIVQ
jgi:HemY protein